MAKYFVLSVILYGGDNKTCCTEHDDSFFNYYCLHRIFCQHVSFRLLVGKDGMILKLSDKRFKNWRRFEFVTMFSFLSMGKYSPIVDREPIRVP